MSKLLPYQTERWFLLLKEAVNRASGKQVADELGVSRPLISQVINGSGAYGAGKASPGRLADRVAHVYGSFACPHLSMDQGREVVITAEQCRSYAHRPVPTTPIAIRHWQDCQQCPHKTHTAPPVAKPVKPRGPRKAKTPEVTE